MKVGECAMKKRFTTTLDEELLKKLRILAVQQDKSISEILEELIKTYLLENSK